MANKIIEHLEEINAPEKQPGAFSKTIIFSVIVVLVVLLSIIMTGYVWAQGYANKIAPHVFVGPVPVGNLDPEIARQRLQQETDEMLTNGIKIRLNNQVQNLPLATLVGTDMTEDAIFNVEAAITQATKVQRSTNPLIDIFKLAQSLFTETRINIPVTLNTENIRSSVSRIFPDQETPAKEAAFKFSEINNQWQVEITKSEPGQTFNHAPFIQTLQNQLEQLDSSSITISMTTAKPEVLIDDVKAVSDLALQALKKAPYTLYFTENDKRQEWPLTEDDIVLLLITDPDSINRLTLDSEAFDLFIDSIAKEIEIKAEDAKLIVKNDRVTHFETSSEGREIDREKTKINLIKAINTLEGESESEIVLNLIDPEVMLAEINNLGISEVLGVGISSYRGSPSNRIKNIQNGINLLNGILIPPGETFSLINALSPFNYENGYLPELVIKGDKIEPEMGGGLCQIGTTTFRATLNSGLKVTQRRNHSLVVSYYNDPSNGNPGTDATIYEPAPDYQFTNDTENYVLFQAELVEETQDLRFTFWGTSDGRQGSYTPPVVDRWIGVGETKEIETTDLEPGKRKCQEAHVGADTHFIYKVVRSNGTVEEETFESHYRPLPKICLVGVDPEAKEIEESNKETEPESDQDSKDASISITPPLHNSTTP
ncbi:VanW family protein [Patescibacteria group bacterium]